MGHRHTSVQPFLEHSAPWIMITYNPGQKYRNFTYNEKFGVYSNDTGKMNSLLVEPEPPTDLVKYTVINSDIDKVIQKVNFEGNMTVKELVDELLQKCCIKNSLIEDADKVKILFYWMTAQNVKYTKYIPTDNFETVNYNLQRLQDGKSSYATFFSMLCYYAGVPCVIIRGHVKGGRYEVNKPLTDNLIREWNAVLIKDQWQLVDSLWGRIYHDQSITREEWYLFPQPSHLKYSHFPQNQTWQLLENPITKDEFIGLPVLKKRFFEMNIELLSHTTGIIRCESGELELSFLLNANNVENQEFHCVISGQNESKEWEEERVPEEHLQLDFIEKTVYTKEEDINGTFLEMEDFDKAEISRNIPLSRMSSYTNTTDSSNIFTALTIKIRFPRRGCYKLEIVGRQSEEEEYDWVAIYHVSVSYVPMRPVFFPRMTDIGWGPNLYLKECGLKAISHTSGEIKCFIPEELKIIFHILLPTKTENVKLRYKLESLTCGSLDEAKSEGTGKSESEIFTATEDSVIVIPINICDIGEYKLSISASLNETDKGDVIHYHILGVENQSKIQQTLVLQVLNEIEAAISSENTTYLKKALNFATSKNVQSHPEVRSKYKEAYRLFIILQNYQDALKRIGQIDKQHIAVLKSYSTPDPGIVRVMRAVFILLGENESRLRYWEDIKVLLKGIGPDSVTKRIKSVDVKLLPLEVVQRAKKEIGDLSTIGALKKAEDIAAFALWLEYVFHSTKALA